MIADVYVTTLKQKGVLSSSHDNLLPAWKSEVWPRLPFSNHPAVYTFDFHFGFGCGRGKLCSTTIRLAEPFWAIILQISTALWLESRAETVEESGASARPYGEILGNLWGNPG